ncbi:5527_t:CDS:2 [Acaulospora colombiana]|uniref:5527_t:CDS:1 n=1 Tax=Acaulospora colombiana TaxID=27376 RepID=A0ACA9KXE6_9GLOM|nr:5527_t:CDS:2 [Acaulospora colombiana]
MVRGNSLTNDLGLLVNNPQYSDLEIKCKNGDILYGNRAILAARSGIFNRTLYVRASETPEKQVSYPKIDASHMKIILEYLYTGIVHEKVITADNAFEVLHAADFFQLEKLQNLISEYYKKMCMKEGIENKAPELLSKAVQLMSPKADNGTIDYLIDIVAKIPLDFIEFDRLSLQGLQCLLSKRDERNVFASSEYSVFRLPPWMKVKEVFQTIKSNSSINKEISKSIADIIKPVVEHIDFKRINPKIIKKIIEPLDIVPSNKILDSYRFLACMATPLSPFYGIGFFWDQNGFGAGLEISKDRRNVLASKTVTSHVSIRTNYPMSSGVHEFHVLNEKDGKFSWIGVCDEGIDVSKHAILQPYGWALGSSGYGIHNNKHVEIAQKFGDNAKIIVHLDMDNKKIAFSVNGTRYPPVTSWENLSSSLYFVASFKFPGRLRILHPDE